MTFKKIIYQKTIANSKLVILFFDLTIKIINARQKI